jgi:DNA-binding transcriptional regulator YiaG/DNA-binding XRE family transcriptional regulator
MAGVVGMDRAAIVRIELGRAPLKYKAARAIIHFLEGNPVWVATGRGKSRPSFPLPMASDLGVDDNASFSEVFDAHFSGYFGPPSKPTKADSSEASAQLSLSASIRHDLIGVLSERLRLWFRQVPDASLVEFMQSLVKCGDLLIVGFGRDDWKEELARRGRMDALDSTANPPNAGGAAAEQVRNKMLTEVTPERNLSGMTEIAFLLQRLKRALEGVKKGDLARSLKVPLPRVSEWLSGRVMPSGETALRLLHWVEQREQKLNALGSATNTTKGKVTRRKLVYEKKPTSSHKQE